MKNRSSADGENPRYSLVKPHQPETAIQKEHTGPIPGTSEIEK